MSKIILITGASSGFGRDTAETLAGAGHRIFASMRDITNRNRAHAQALQAKGIDVVDIDVTDDESVERGVESVIAQAGRLDVLINNAGIGSQGVSESFTTDQLRALFEVNVFGVQRTLRTVLPTLRRQENGLVINIGSILGRVTLPFFGLYGASKFAVEAITDSYRYELSQLGIDVVLVQPSSYPTSIFATAQQPADPARVTGYGEIGGIPNKMLKTFTEIFESENAPNPHEVAEAIKQILETPQGSRPERVVVGESFGADAINTVAVSVQAQVIEGLGLGQLVEPRKQSWAA